LHQEEVRQVLIHTVDQIVRDIFRYVAGPLPLSDRGPEFHSRQSEKGERMPAGRISEPEHLFSARLANV
jgi:hypothetical protein